MASMAWCFGEVEMKWPLSAYDRDQLPERVLQFGSGMLLRALCVAAVDSANRAGARAGRIVVVQSTTEGASRTARTGWPDRRDLARTRGGQSVERRERCRGEPFDSGDRQQRLGSGLPDRRALPRSAGGRAARAIHART